MPIDVATPENRNVTQKETEKKKYKSLIIEMQRMRNMKRMIIPVINGTTGTEQNTYFTCEGIFKLDAKVGKI